MADILDLSLFCDTLIFFRAIQEIAELGSASSDRSLADELKSKPAVVKPALMACEIKKFQAIGMQLLSRLATHDALDPANFAGVDTVLKASAEVTDPESLTSVQTKFEVPGPPRQLSFHRSCTARVAVHWFSAFPAMTSENVHEVRRQPPERTRPRDASSRRRRRWCSFAPCR